MIPIKNKGAEPASDLDIVFCRVFAAPQELVWQSCTESAHMARWWGPRDLTTILCEMDVQPGGTWRNHQRDAEGKVYAFWGEYLEVLPCERLVHTQRFLDYPPLHVTILLESCEGGTRMTSMTRVSSLAEREALLGTGMARGAEQSLDRLTELLAERLALQV